MTFDFGFIIGCIVGWTVGWVVLDIIFIIISNIKYYNPKAYYFWLSVFLINCSYITYTLLLK